MDRKAGVGNEQVDKEKEKGMSRRERGERRMEKSRSSR